MKAFQEPVVRLTPRQLRLRAAALFGIIVGGLVLRAVDPTGLSWLPLRTSCGAATGLPCIFCGTTRALHYLLNGEIARALYFNWLAFLVAAAALAMFLVLGLEIIRRRRLFAVPKIHFTPRLAAITASCTIALWIFQVSLALAGHKQELLNPDGLLYALFVK